MARLQDLQLVGEAVEQAPAMSDLPDQFGSRVEPLQPGIYRFELPKDLSGIWVKLEQLDLPFRDPQGNEQPKKGDRISAVFDDDHPLLIVQSPSDSRNGEAFNWRVSNAERWRDKAHTSKAADLDYVLRALGETAHPGFGNNAGYAQGLEKYAGKQFTAEATISYYSSPKRDIYAEFVDAQQQRTVQEVPGVRGNGRRFDQAQVTRDEHGRYPTTIPHAIVIDDPTNPGQQITYTQIIRGFNDLTNLRP